MAVYFKKDAVSQEKGRIVMLHVKNLSKRYEKTLAVDNVSFRVRSGELAVLLGPNGAG